MEIAVDVNEDALDAIEKKSNACKAGVGGETEESCALLLLQKTNAEAEYDSAVAMVEQLNSDKDKLDAATAQPRQWALQRRKWCWRRCWFHWVHGRSTAGMDVSGGGGVHDHVGGGSSTAGYMVVAPAAGGDAFGASDEGGV
eukprot:gene7894-27074_t